MTVIKKKDRVLWLTTLALLIALQVVLGNVTQVALQEKQHNFGFLPIAVAGWLMGPLGGAIVGALGDVVGVLLFPSGAYFPGFTLTSALTGVIYGLLLHKKKVPVWRCVTAVVLTLALNLVLNSLWLSILYTSHAYWGWVGIRAPLYAIDLLLQIPLVCGTIKALERTSVPKRFLKE